MQARGIKGTIICRRGKNIRQPTYWCFPYCFFVFTTCKYSQQSLIASSSLLGYFSCNTSALWPKKFHTNDQNQCLHDKSGSHGVLDANLIKFPFLPLSNHNILSFSNLAPMKSSNSSGQANVFIGNRCFKADSVHQYTWFLRVFVLCLLFVNRSKQLRAPEQSTDRLIPSKSKG